MVKRKKWGRGSSYQILTCICCFLVQKLLVTILGCCKDIAMHLLKFSGWMIVWVITNPTQKSTSPSFSTGCMSWSIIHVCRKYWKSDMAQLKNKWEKKRKKTLAMQSNCFLHTNKRCSGLPFLCKCALWAGGKNSKEQQSPQHSKIPICRHVLAMRWPPQGK